MGGDGGRVVVMVVVGWCAKSFLCPTQLECGCCVVFSLGL